MTNREWLRSLTDNELAEIFCDNDLGGVCNICAYDGIECEELECNDGIAEWLQKEHKNDNRRKGAKIRKPKRLQCGNEPENPPAEEREITDAKKIKKMIKLTIANSHKPIYINPDWIMYIRECSHSDETFIALGTQGATVIVEEDLATIERHIS